MKFKRIANTLALKDWYINTGKVLFKENRLQTDHDDNEETIEHIEKSSHDKTGWCVHQRVE